MLSSAGIAFSLAFGDRRAVAKLARISTPQLNLIDLNNSAFLFTYAILICQEQRSMLPLLLLQLSTLSTCRFSLPAAARPHGAASVRAPLPASIRQTERLRMRSGVAGTAG